MNALARVGLVLAMSLVTVGAGDVQRAAGSNDASTEPFVVTIPKGAYTAALSGITDIGVPKEITVRVRQKIVIQNNDEALHYLTTRAILPGESTIVSFDRPGIFAYSDGLVCSIQQEGATVITVRRR